MQGVNISMEKIKNTAVIADWLINKVAALNNMSISEIKIDIPLSEYRLDSLNAVNLAGELEEWLKIEIDPTLIWDYPTIRELSEFLNKEILAETGATV